MNQTIPTPPNTETLKRSDNPIVALSVFVLPSQASLFALFLLINTLRAEFRRAGIQLAEDCGGLAGPGFLLCLFKVGDQRAAVRAIHALMSELGLLTVSQIAYFDRDEVFWRSVYPEKAGLFDIFFAPEHARVNEEKLAVAAAELAALASAFPQRP